MIQLCYVPLVTSASSSGWTSSYAVSFSRPWLADLLHREPTFSYTEVCPGTGKWCPIFQFVTIMPKVQFGTLSYLSSCLLIAVHPPAWPSPVPYSMMFWWACQSHSSPFNPSDESRNTKYSCRACQRLELFSGKSQEGPFAWSRVTELEE